METLNLLAVGHEATAETSKLMQKQIATMATLLDQQKVNGLSLDNQTRNALIRGLSKNVSEQITPPLTQNLDKTIGSLSSSVDNSVAKNLARMKTSVSSTMNDSRKDMRKVKDEIRVDVGSQVVDEMEEHRSRTVDVVLAVLVHNGYLSERRTAALDVDPLDYRIGNRHAGLRGAVLGHLAWIN
ncbi:hypothetical protein CTheo_9169 [Ceratobasidium theobromae]|uniref:Uncharacterized protein n=1 Tax=Ceratobasidium theobromae TaxID=1582974 RepID=A0A5N5Q649_9AGAM|nr:hypothetical protein CTheo_9169 [Ceratobasidium theobromae]